MVEFHETGRLVLRYESGQFSFSRYDCCASDEELYGLARQLNSFQVDEAQKVLKIRVMQLVPIA